jgi:hypothetical protein
MSYDCYLLNGREVSNYVLDVLNIASFLRVCSLMLISLEWGLFYWCYGNIGEVNAIHRILEAILWSLDIETGGMMTM